MQNQSAIRDARLSGRPLVGVNAATRRYSERHSTIERMVSALRIAVLFGSVAWFILLNHATDLTH